MEELAEAARDGTRKQYMESVATVALLIIDDLGMRKLPQTAAEDLFEIIMRRYERARTLLTSNRPVDGWDKLLADVEGDFRRPAIPAAGSALRSHPCGAVSSAQGWHTILAAAGGHPRVRTGCDSSLE